MRTMIYPGTFDPLTNGHVDIARRAAALCDHLVIAVLNNSSKKTVFRASERADMVRCVLQDADNITVVAFSGLLVDLYQQMQASAVVRGLRSAADFQFEAQMAAANQIMLPDFETCLLPCRADLAFLSSSIVREVASYGGDFTGMVPAELVPRIRECFSKTMNNPSENGG